MLSGQIINIPDDYSRIQLGINAAINGDTVLVDTGTYFERINFTGKNIVVASKYIITLDSNDIHQTIIDGDSLGSVVSIINGEDSTTQLSGFTIRNGADTLGGGIKLINSSLTINNCIITNNIAYKEGGGIYSSNSNPYISYSSISYNQILNAGNGGGMCLSSSGGAINNSDISHNSILKDEWASGGGIHYHNSNTLLNNLDVSYNNAGSFSVGGGIYVSVISGYNIIFKNLKVCNNYGEAGGGISTRVPLWNSARIEIVSSLFENNQSNFIGGGAVCSGQKTIFTNCTFASNSGGEGGIYLPISTEVDLVNTILYNNSPSELHIQWDEQAAITKLTYCNLYPNGVSGNANSVSYLEGNINADPCFWNNGSSSYMLCDTSPCVNSGILDTTGLNLPELDLENNMRVFGGRIDMGAYENQNVSLSIEENTTHSFSIEPNPFHNETFIRWKSNQITNANIDLYDLTGRKMRNLYKLFTISEDDIIPINLTGLKKGTYILIITTNKNNIAKRIIKN